MPQPKFVPKPGQVDYTSIRYAPVVNVIVTFKGKILCVQRSPQMRLYPNLWDWVCGFLDDDQSIEAKAREELHEELGLQPSDIKSLRRGQAIIDEAPHYKKTWLIVPILAEVKTNKITLDWEASEYKWCQPHELSQLNFVPNALRAAAQFFPDMIA